MCIQILVMLGTREYSRYVMLLKRFSQSIQSLEMPFLRYRVWNYFDVAKAGYFQAK